MRRAAVIGLGQFGYQIATSLSQKGFEVIGFDKEPNTISEIKDLISQALIIDSSDELAMRETDISTVDLAIVAFGTNVQSSLLTTALLQNMGIDNIYVRAITSLQEKILTTMGVPHIINIEKDMGIQLANMLTSSRIGRYIDISDHHALLEVRVPSTFVGKRLKDIPFRPKHKLNVVGIKSKAPFINDDGETEYSMQLTTVPDPEYEMQKEDTLLIAGKDHHINAFLDLEDDHE